MPRKSKNPFGQPFKNPFAVKATRKAKEPPEPPAMRRPDLERMLCEAIGKLVRVRLVYESDFQERLFEPHAVYTSTRDKVCVSGVQIGFPPEPHNFEVGKITALRLTDERFAPDSRFDRFDRKYENGIICSI